MKNAAIIELRKLALEYKRNKYPNVPYLETTIHHYSDNSANGLTRCIIDFLKFSGWQAERVANMGKYVDARKHYVDILGHNRIIGTGKWISGQGRRGSADIHATIAGVSVKIEVKFGQDQQSVAQKQYQQSIQQAGGIYYIARDLNSFFDWYTKQFQKNPAACQGEPG